MRFHVTTHSTNQKLGGMATTTSSRDTCPPDCPFLKNGCYGENFPLAHHWNAVSDGRRGTDDVEQHCAEIRLASLQTGMIRLYQAGNSPEDLDVARKISDAPHPKAQAFTYEHRGIERTRDLQDTRTVVNGSANTIAEADDYLDAGLPTVCVQANDLKKQHTPAGRIVVRCPAEYRDDTTCRTCGNGSPLCARKDRAFAVGFTPHGNKAAKVAAIAAA